MTMRVPALASALLLVALATPFACGLAAEVSFDAPDARGHLADVAGGAGVPPPPAALPPLPGGLQVETSVEVGPIGKASVGLSGSRPKDDGPLPPAAEAVAEVAAPAVAAAGFLALLQAFGGFRALALGGVALYSRLAKSDLLDNEHRDKVFRLVQESPGIGLSEIGQRTGLGWGTTVYHLDRLERAQMVTSERVGLHRCYFPAGSHPRAARKGIGALKMETTRSVAAFLVQRPGASQTELCEGLGLSASAASKQVTKLEAAGLVRRERDGKTVRLYPEESLSPLLVENGSVPAAPFAAALPVRVAASA